MDDIGSARQVPKRSTRDGRACGRPRTERLCARTRDRSARGGSGPGAGPVGSEIEPIDVAMFVTRTIVRTDSWDCGHNASCRSGRVAVFFRTIRAVDEARTSRTSASAVLGGASPRMKGGAAREEKDHAAEQPTQRSATARAATTAFFRARRGEDVPPSVVALTAYSTAPDVHPSSGS